MALKHQQRPHQMLAAARRRTNLQFELSADTRFPRKNRRDWQAAFEANVAQEMDEFGQGWAMVDDAKSETIRIRDETIAICQQRLMDAGCSLVDTSPNLTIEEKRIIKSPLIKSS
jgi:hypothetical protein